LFSSDPKSSFLTATFSWLSPNWHNELITNLKESRPKYVIGDKELGHWFEDTYFLVAENKHYFDQTSQFILDHYELYQETPSYGIYQLKSD